MREILEELYYGNTTPCDRQIRSGTSLMKAMEQPQECEEKLTKLPEARPTVCCCGSSTRRTRSAAPWPWRTSSWVSGWECA